MIGMMWRLSRGYRLRPWLSPYLRWRMETYRGVDADAITFRQFWKFVWTHRRELARYLKWAERMAQKTKAPRTLARGFAGLPEQPE